MTVLGELLAGDDASRLYLSLVKGRELALNLDGFFGMSGAWQYDGPTLFTIYALYKPTSSADALLAVIDQEIARITKEGVDEPTLKRIKTRLLANWYNGLESFMNRADRLAQLQTVWGDANVVNQIPNWIAGVKSADVQRTAKTYMTVANRSVIDRKPVAPSASVAAPAVTVKP